MNNHQYKVVLFDFDGTLVDQFEAIHQAYSHALESVGVTPPDHATIKTSVGVTLASAMAEFCPKDSVEEAIRHFHEKYRSIRLENLIVLQGAHWILENLKSRGFRTAIFTNNNADNVRLLAKHIGFDPHLDLILGHGDTPHQKPDPEYSLHILDTMNVSPEEACLIGDSTYDVDAAASVNMHSLIMPTGTHTTEQLLAHINKPTFIYNDLHHLGEEVFGLEKNQVLEPLNA